MLLRSGEVAATDAGETLFSYETDKSAFDEPSPAAGTGIGKAAGGQG